MSATTGNNQAPEEEDEDDERMDFKAIQSFADKIQYLPSDASSSRPRITLPKRGEKDFEPLQETVNLQEMMLQKSREALFNAMTGVRGGSSKNIAHALLTPDCPYPHIIIVRGHLLDQMGIAMRSTNTGKGKGKARVELLPEEALYLLERGSLQIWLGPEAKSEEEQALGVGEWQDAEWGVRGAIEMSVQEGFATFLGKDGLSWERYQAYAYLKRLGYIVQRSQRFIPEHFLLSSDDRDPDGHDARLPPFRTWWLSIPGWIRSLVRFVWRPIAATARTIAQVGLGSAFAPGTLLRGWNGANYGSLYAALRIKPHGAPRDSSISEALSNPYLPFFHVWKPATPWSKAKWEKGSQAGLLRQRPDYFVAVVEGRRTPLPTQEQLDQVYAELPDEPTGPTRKTGPQYRTPKPQAPPAKESSASWSWPWTRKPPTKSGNPFGALRNGDRAFIVAVNDSGNTGWVRFGRSDFSGAPMVQG